MRFVLVHPAFLGDTVFLGPAVRALKARWQSAEVAVVVSPRGEQVARLLPGVDEVYVFDKRQTAKGLRGLLRLGREIRAFSPDVALVSHPSARSGALAWLSRAERRIGYAPLCNEKVPLDRGRPFVDRVLSLAVAAGASPGDRRLELRPPSGLERYTDEALRGAPEPLVGIVPGAEWATKRWGEERFAALARRLVDAVGGTIVLLGGPAERDVARRISEGSGVPVRDTTGNSIPEALSLLARCGVVVGGDTGLVHCARALGRPTVVVFGPTDPGRHVFGAAERPVWLKVECAPCHDHGPKRCPLRHHRCMVDLEVERVARPARELLEGAARRAVAPGAS
ncbi:MAG TPA: glycosyltransferase family 9 protein [Anaeromyxobacteraceae bacterium]|nr:glycosyltransferase family 9 protein [Anaeromyxobacteraceae bacterium]